MVYLYSHHYNMLVVGQDSVVVGWDSVAVG